MVRCAAPCGPRGALYPAQPRCRECQGEPDEDSQQASPTRRKSAYKTTASVRVMESPVEQLGEHGEREHDVSSDHPQEQPPARASIPANRRS